MAVTRSTSYSASESCPSACSNSMRCGGGASSVGGSGDECSANSSSSTRVICGSFLKESRKIFSLIRASHARYSTASEQRIVAVVRRPVGPRPLIGPDEGILHESLYLSVIQGPRISPFAYAEKIPFVAAIECRPRRLGGNGAVRLDSHGMEQVRIAGLRVCTVFVVRHLAQS